MNRLEAPVLNGDLLERERSLLPSHCEEVLLYFGSYDVLNSEQFGELCSSVRVFCCPGLQFRVAFFADELMRQRCTCFGSFPLF